MKISIERMPQYFTRNAAAYAPAPKNAEWPNDRSPVYPSRRLKPSAAIPKISPYDTWRVSKGGRTSGSPRKTRTPTISRTRRRVMTDTTPGRAVRSRSCASEEAGRPEEEDNRRDEIEDRELDLREVGDAERPDHAHDHRAGERALQRPQSADDHDDERENQRLHAHPQHRAGDRHDHRAPQTGHEAPEGERLNVDALHVDAE